MQNSIIDLSELVNLPKTDSISGRSYGEGYANKTKILDKIKANEHIDILIDDEKVKAINDSFIKGLFNEVFKYLKTKDKVKQQVNIIGSEDFISLFDKNWSILEAIYNG